MNARRGRKGSPEMFYFFRMDGSGTLSWEEFLRGAEGLVGVSEAISDRWELRGCKVCILFFREGLVGEK